MWSTPSCLCLNFTFSRRQTGHPVYWVGQKVSFGFFHMNVWKRAITHFCCIPGPHYSALVFCRSILSHLGLSRWCSGKESACQCRKCKRHRFDPWIGKILGVGHGNLLQYSWKIPWTEEPGRLQSIVSLRVGHD